jgi:hypothetical protein
MATEGAAMLPSLLTRQRELEARLNSSGSTPQHALAAGEALLAFAGMEDEAFSALAPYLDPAAQAELAAEHQQLAEDIELLDWLVQTTPDSADVTVLTASLLQRMRQHVARDGRLLTRAVSLSRRG